jgi:hypothetical protein
MDMMHSLAFAIPPVTPTLLSATLTGNGNKKQAVLNWKSIINATNFTVQRATDSGFTTNLVTVPLGNTTTYTDTVGSTMYFYRLFASNVVGDTAVYAGSPNGFPTKTANSGYSNVLGVNLPPPPAAPSNLTATILSSTSIRLNWTDNANNETGFRIEISTNGGTSYSLLTNVGANIVTYTNSALTTGTTYTYRVQAFNAGGSSAFSARVTVTLSSPLAPSGFTATAARANGNNDTVTLRWTDNSNNEASFTIQRATNSTFTAGLTNFTSAANTTTLVQTVGRALTYYYRIQAINPVGSSAQVNATTFPVVTP